MFHNIYSNQLVAEWVLLNINQTRQKTIVRIVWIILYSEAAFQRFSLKRMFLKCATNLQENTHTAIKLLCNFTKIALRRGCSRVNLLHIFRTPFPKNASGGLPLYYFLYICNLFILYIYGECFMSDSNHCQKYRNFTWFPGVEILQKGTVFA